MSTKNHNEQLLREIHESCCKKCSHYKPRIKNNCSIFCAIIEPVLNGKAPSPFTDSVVSKQFRTGVCKCMKEE